MSDEPRDALDPAFALPVLVIQLTRVYDALITLIRQGPAGDELSKALLAEHAAGKLLTPPPNYVQDEE